MLSKAKKAAMYESMMPQIDEISIDVDVLTEKQLRPERGEVGQELAEVKGGVGQTVPLAFGESLNYRFGRADIPIVLGKADRLP
jgi:hypothetical protein